MKTWRALTASAVVVFGGCLGDDGGGAGLDAIDTVTVDLGEVGDAIDSAPDAAPETNVDTTTDTAVDTTVVDTTVADTTVADVADTAVDSIVPVDTSDTTETSDYDTLPDTVGGDVSNTVDASGPGPLAVLREEVEVAGFPAVLFRPDTVAPVPTVVLLPGFQIDGNAYELYGERLASHAVATLVVTFGDSLFAPLTHDALADAVVEMIDWLAADQRFDGNHLGVAGHSRGGKIAFLAATRSTRIKAVFGLDPVDAAGGPGAQPSADFPSVAPELMPRVTVPVAIIGSVYGGTTASPLAPACAPVEDNYHQYTVAATAAVSVREWVAPASGHNDFADPLPFLLSLVCQAGDDPGATRAFAMERLVAFFRNVLGNDARYIVP